MVDMHRYMDLSILPPMFLSEHGGERMQRNDKRIRGFKWFFTRWNNGRRKIHLKVKDRLFRFLFTQDREALLQLYNALNGTDYQDASQLKVVMVENAVYVVMKNDLAFILAGTLNLYEHQSTYNPNMPVRFLIYLAQEYQRLVSEAESSLYGSRQIQLPTPRCVVFYNGEKDAPEEQIWKLSDAFTNKEKTPDLELRVRMLTIHSRGNTFAGGSGAGDTILYRSGDTERGV